VARTPRPVARAFVGLYRLAVRSRAKAFSVLASGSFASFGKHSVIELPVRLGGEDRIAVGDGVYVAAGTWLEVLPGHGEGVALTLGDGTSIAGPCVLTAVRSVTLGRKVLLARNVYISDHMHAFESPGTAVLDQGITRIAPVEIGDGAWLGENVVVGPGVRIGRGAVIGANAVVLDDVPEYSVAVGMPARVVRSLVRDDEPVA
jgi:acetyltransferase-like isoleucine patch superfamily enzyme